MHSFVKIAVVGILSVAALPVYAAKSPLDNIENIVVLYGENRSFDNLYGLFPKANGIRNATQAQFQQIDNAGKVLASLPPVWLEGSRTNEIDPAFVGKDGKPMKLANQPFRLDQPPFNLSPDKETRDLVHRFYQNQEQINSGKNNTFAAVSDAGGLTMGYYDSSSMKLWKLAKKYTLADNFFMGAFGGSYMNHIYLVCACVGEFVNPPSSIISAVNDDGVTLKRDAQSPASAMDGAPIYVANKSLTPDGFAVNTIQPPFQPSGIAPAPGSDPMRADPSKFPLPPQTKKTIGDTLSEKGVSWAWYSGSWNAALKDGQQAPDAPRTVIYNGKNGGPNFQAHHQPFNYFANYAPGTRAREEHLKDVSDLENDIAAGRLPAVTFYKPQGTLNQHPGYADVMAGDEHIAELVKKIQKGPQWKKTLIIVTYDENGGFWDHVAPPSGDRWGPGTRIPTILISPWVKQGFVDHTSYDTSSILKLITKRFSLTPLEGVRQKAGDLTAALVPAKRKHE
jgi:acid phosphatase